MPEQNRLLSPEDDFAYGAGIPRDATWKNLLPAAELGLAIAPGSGEAMAVRDAWNASGQGANALLQGQYGDAAGNYANALLALGGAIPGAGIIARGTRRGAAWMDRNLPQGFNRLLDSAMPSDPMNTTFIFAGPTAKTADQQALSKAQELAASGSSRDDIWQQTGWFQGVDGKWRFEIDDSGAMTRRSAPEKVDELDRAFQRANAEKESALNVLLSRIEGGKLSREEASELLKPYDEKVSHIAKLRNKAVIAGRNLAESGRFSDVMSHDDLFSSYSIPNYRAELNADLPPGTRGDYTKGNFGSALIRSSRKGAPERQLSNILHESQHGVQNIEGFAVGGSPSDFEINNAYDLYRRLAGEVEARNVQTRMNMSPAERRAKAPWETQDVPDDQQIVRFR